VTFDVDANGILNVSAAEKSTGKSNKITITNDKGRLSKDDIERMVSEASSFEAEDKQRMEVVEARNSLESYIYNVRNSLNDEKTREKLGAEMCDTNLDKTKVYISWLESNTMGSKSDYEEQKKKAEEDFQPFFMKLYATDENMKGTASTQDNNGMPSEGMPSGPKIEEVD
jgi:L1 cell adhesion molecule like protein